MGKKVNRGNNERKEETCSEKQYETKIAWRSPFNIVIGVVPLVLTKGLASTLGRFAIRI